MTVIVTMCVCNWSCNWLEVWTIDQSNWLGDVYHFVWERNSVGLRNHSIKLDENSHHRSFSNSLAQLRTDFDWALLSRTVGVTKLPSGWMAHRYLLLWLGLPFCCLKSRLLYTRMIGIRILGTGIVFSSELKDVLSNIIYHISCTLKILSLRRIIKVPNTFSLHIQVVHLTTLELHSLSPNDFGNENLTSLTQAASKGVAPMASHAVIDWCVCGISARKMCAVRDSLYLLISH